MPTAELRMKFEEIIVMKKPQNRLSIDRPTLTGRTTCIVPVKRSYVDPHTEVPFSGENLVVKASWTEKSKGNEADIICEARRRLINSMDKDMIKCLPRLIALMDISISDTSVILYKAEVESSVQRTLDSEARVLRLLLFPELIPLNKISSMDDVVKAWLDCLKCHYALWTKDVGHLDISVWNLMWDPKNKCGVLNDWDLSFVADGVKQLEGDDIELARTGSIPFMARKLLWDIIEDEYNPRVYRHEVELFIWVFTWMCIKDSKPNMVTAWRKGSHDIVRKDKIALLFDYRRLKITSPGWEKCTLLLDLLVAIDQFLRREQEEPDNQLLLAVKIMEGEITTVNEVNSLPLGVNYVS